MAQDINKSMGELCDPKGEDMKKLRSIIFSASTIVNIFMFNILTFATGTADVDAPTLTEVRSIVGA